MGEIVRWGLLGTSGFAKRRVLPALKEARYSRMIAVASRDLPRARAYAEENGIARAYGSYDELLADPEIDAVHIALPNHKHVAWSIRAAEAGKHVLCEKPISLEAADVAKIINARDRHKVKMGEAFMVASHPQWLKVRDLVQSGRIGEMRAIQTSFGFMLSSTTNIRNVLEFGGGALFDIGCYPVFCSRFALQQEPRRVFCTMEFDPDSKVDRVTSGILDFGGVQSSFVCSINVKPHQRMSFWGARGRVELEIPFNAPEDRPTRVFLDDPGGPSVIETPGCNQFTLEFDAFSQAILENKDVPVSLESASHNMKVLDALRASAQSGAWEAV